jgi:SAM-dependent methyltransferase
VKPNPDATAAARLGSALRRLDYTEDTLLERLGEEAYSSEPAQVLVHERRLGETKLDTAIRLLFLQRPVRGDDVRRAFGDAGAEALATLRLARAGASVTPRSKVAPVRDVLVASDGFSRGASDPPDYVATYSPASRLCDMLTPRPRVRRALDVGTGNGVHALLAARHARHVVATDVNPRALAFTRLNAGLNGLDNVEVRRGSLYEPAGAEPLDLIVCNAPFVVSPDTTWQYRDTSLPEDTVSEHVVRGAIKRLAAGGWATLGVSWLARKAGAPHERPLAWLAGSGCDAWILPIFQSEPLEHAAAWSDHLSGHELESALDRWAAYFEQLGVREIFEGAIVLHRRDSGGSIRIDHADADTLEPADAQIRRAFAAREFDDDTLLAARLAPKADVEQRLRGKRVAAGWVSLDEGTQPVLDVPPALAASLAAGEPARRRDLSMLRELAALGFLRRAT